MTDKTEVSLVEEVEASDAGAQGLAAADLAGQVARLLQSALVASDLDQKDLAAKIGVSPGRVSQVLNSDGNIRIAALARYLCAMGYKATITGTPVDASVPALPERRPRQTPRRKADAHDLSPTRPRAGIGDLWARLSSATGSHHENAGRSTAGCFKLILHAATEGKAAAPDSVVDLARCRSRRQVRHAWAFDRYAVERSSPLGAKTGNG